MRASATCLLYEYVLVVITNINVTLEQPQTIAQYQCKCFTTTTTFVQKLVRCLQNMTSLLNAWPLLAY